ncbi:MAG: hypothetical protein ACYC3P_10390 [Bellilinea sp.]
MTDQTQKPVERKLLAQAASEPLRLRQLALPGASFHFLEWVKTWIKKWQPSQVLPIILMVVGSAAWLFSLPQVNLDRMNDLGLVSTLPITAWIALGLLAVSFSLVLTAPKVNSVLILFHMIILVFMLYGITAIVETVPRFGPSWRHAGVIDYILRNENVNPRIDAYFNWPGFFIMGGLIAQIAGLDSAIYFLKWSPFFFQLLYMGPLWMIYNSLTRSRRLVWFGIWVFYLVNWVGQDYFSPQAMNFFYFLVILAILLRWFRSTEVTIPRLVNGKFLQRMPKIQGFITRLFTSEKATSVPTSLTQKSFFLLMIVLIYFVSITSHQLTQFAILFSVLLLLIFQRITPKTLPTIMLVLSGMWIAYMASAFMAGRLKGMLEAFGQLETALDANLVNRMNGSPGHMVVTQLRLVLTLGVWLAAMLGFVRQWVRGLRETSAALLVAAPFPLLIMQTYGGEMLMRIYMFSLPLAAFLAAALIFPIIKEPPSWRYTAVVGLVSAGLLVVFWFGRYGNERMEYFTPAEVEAVEFIYQHAEPGSLIATVTTNLPYKYINYEKYKYVKLEKDLVLGDMVSLFTTLKNPKYDHAYLLLTRAQEAYVEMYYDPGLIDFAKLENQLLFDPQIKVIYTNPDAKILEITNFEAAP